MAIVGLGFAPTQKTTAATYGLPNLVPQVTSVEVEDDGTFSYTVSLFNMGSGDASGFTLKTYVYSHNVVTPTMGETPYDVSGYFIPFSPNNPIIHTVLGVSEFSLPVRICAWVDSENAVTETNESDNMHCMTFVQIEMTEYNGYRTAQYYSYGNEPRPGQIDHYYAGTAHWVAVSWIPAFCGCYVADLTSFNVQPGQWLQFLPGSAALWDTHQYVLTLSPVSKEAGWRVEYNRWIYSPMSERSWIPMIVR